MVIFIICVSLVSSSIAVSDMFYWKTQDPLERLSPLYLSYKMVNSSHEGTHVVSNNTQTGCGIQTMLN